MKAVILAAGKGVRMAPLTEDKPKVLIEVAGKPFLWHVLRNFEKAGINEIALIVGYKKEKIFDFAKHYGFSLTFIEQEKQLGTGHAVLLAKEWVGNSKFILAMGDNLCSAEDIKHLSKLPDDLAYVGAYESDHPQYYGVLETEKNALVKIHEKPSHPKSNLINTGLYKFTPEIFKELINLKFSSRGEIELTDAITNLASLGKARVYTLKDYWIDMSVKEDLPAVEEKIKKLY